MPPEIVFVGYTCPLCGKRVPVLRSCDPPPINLKELVSTCECGFVRRVEVEQIQDMDVWRVPLEDKGSR